MLYRIKWSAEETEKLPTFVYVDDGSIFDNMFSEYIRSVAASADESNIIQIIDYRSNPDSDFCRLPVCYKNFLENYNSASIESFSDAYHADIVKYVKENNIYVA